jgi:glucans biosynthesis protein
MADAVDRRALISLLLTSAAAPWAPTLASAAAPPPLPAFGRPTPFSFERLKALAKAKAAKPYAGPPAFAPEILQRLDYPAWGAITFDTDEALFKDSRFPVTFFHLGRLFQHPVTIHAVEAGRAREVIYDERYFHLNPDSPARQLPPGGGFAGFRVQEPRDGALDWRTNDWVAFLGGCYFRAIGALRQYGLSARAVALNTAVDGEVEEFPAFTQIYIERPAPDARDVTVHALVEGPSIVGACRFRMTRGEGVVMEVDQTLHLRRPVKRFGLAPMTSMYWFSETLKPVGVDWRPEVHDSDGLAMLTGRGERIWRPLNNPPRIAVSAFSDENPKGFGLMQRDHDFSHYLDGVRYDRRPSLWVEPRGDWGKGGVQLIEFPTDNEATDNIFAAWVPAAPATAGQTVELSYGLYWLADMPNPGELAQCVATRLGAFDQARRFVVEFQGPSLTNLLGGARPEPVLTTSRGRIVGQTLVEPMADGETGHWRVQFDLADASGADPAELRLALVAGGKSLTETWSYQYHPS